jgi:hypothetical protein
MWIDIVIKHNLLQLYIYFESISFIFSSLTILQVESTRKWYTEIVWSILLSISGAISTGHYKFGYIYQWLEWKH